MSNPAIKRARKLVVPAENSDEVRRRLRFYLIGRVVLAIALGLLVLIGPDVFALGEAHPRLFWVTVLGYLILSLLAYALFRQDRIGAESEYLLAMLVDSTTVGLMLYASGGLASGLGILLAVSVVNASLGVRRRSALLAASFATLSVFTEVLAGQPDAGSAGYTQAGLLGLGYFGLALLANQLSTRAAATEALAAERGVDIRNLTELNEHVIQHMQAGVLVVDENAILRLMNQAAWSLLGTPETGVGHPITEVSGPLAKYLSAWRDDPTQEVASFRPLPSGRDLRASFRRLSSSGGTLVVLEDRAWLTEQAQQMKLASLGRLVASIAHEIRNPLGAISHAAQLLAESDVLAGSDRRMAEIIQGNSGRLNEVVENVLALSRRSPPSPEVLELQSWLQQTVIEIGLNLGLEPRQIECYIAPSLSQVRADKAQLNQILTILMENSATHFTGGGKRLSIGVSAGISSPGFAPYLEISDNGPGIPETVLDRIYDPFFTTRNAGTGLGLYLARELCDANNIRIEYIPISIGGSCFRLTFTDQAQQRRQA